jgi:hypothetical protein
MTRVVQAHAAALPVTQAARFAGGLFSALNSDLILHFASRYCSFLPKKLETTSPWNPSETRNFIARGRSFSRAAPAPDLQEAVPCPKIPNRTPCVAADNGQI